MFVALSGVVLLVCSCWGQTVENRSRQAGGQERLVASFASGKATHSDFKRVWKFVIGPSPKWREIPWIPSLWQGVKVSQASNKPIFIWAMNGDPLGCV